jgi:tRNA threonylcarbamoyladenosine biosynthesis protein TsaB
MRLLAFDTATPDTVVALGGRELRHTPAPGARPGHAAELLPLAARLLEEAGLAFGDLDRIAVGTGPGTFTGLRIGVATARALAQSTGAQLVGVPTLAALARPAGSGRVLAVLDARRGEAFVAVHEGGAQAAGAAAVTPAVLGGMARPDTLAVGDGAVRFRDVLEASGADVPPDDSPLHRVSAIALAELAAALPEGGGEVVPEYVRLPDAELALRRKRT